MKVPEWNRLLAALTAFDGPVPSIPPGVDWDAFAGICERHGLAPIVSYQLEYRWPGRFGVPGEVRERLLASYQGVLSDNVFKLVQLKQLLAGEGVPEVVLLGAAAAADAFYPHIAFRPVPQLELLVRATDLPRALAAFGERGFHPLGPPGAGAVVGDGRLTVQIGTTLPGLARRAPEVEALFARKAPALPYGRHAFRLGPEDAFLAAVTELSHDAFQVARVQLVDLREMALRGARGSSGFWDPEGGAPLDLRGLKDRARAAGLARPLHCALELLAGCFPETARACAALDVDLPARVRAVLRRAVVDAALDPTRRSSLRGSQAIRRALLGA